MELEEKDLLDIYMHGKKLAEKIKEDKNAEFKINSIAFKFLNTLKHGNTNHFINEFLKIHTAYNLEVPKILTKLLQDKNSLYALGYSFIAGLLGYEAKIKNDIDQSKTA
jgi:CRISPR-associated protein Cst1